MRPGRPPLWRMPAHLETPPARGPRPSRAHLPRARAPVHLLPPGSGPASSLSAHLPRSALHPDAAHLSFVRGGTTGSFRDCPLCARRRAKPELAQSSQTLGGKRLAAPLPRLSGVWPFAQGHADLNTHADGSHLATEPQCLPWDFSTALGDKTITLVAGIVMHLLCAKRSLPHFTFQQPWKCITLLLQARKEMQKTDGGLQTQAALPQDPCPSYCTGIY